MKPTLWLPLIMGANVWVFALAQENPTEPLPAPKPPPSAAESYTVFAYNDLGMHCLNKDFSELCVLPPANTLRAQVIRRGSSPEIIFENLQVKYSVPGNTQSATKTNFWKYAKPLFGVQLPTNVGLFGFGLSGQMQPTSDRDYAAFGIPLTQITDAGVDDSYQLAKVDVFQSGVKVASTQNVVPVSWEMSCNQCHKATSRTTMEGSILVAHDKRHGTNLYAKRPVLCASCHADPALGAPGVSGVKSLSAAMHGAHALRMPDQTSENTCYACHPGPKTQCLRDVHKANGMTCSTCHGGMTQVANPARRPWQDEPKCGDCHRVPGHEYEQPGKLFRDSVGHNGVKCIVCHNSPHAIAPSSNPRDNVQAVTKQGHAGTIDTCTVCHTQRPSDPFNHTAHGD
ncbi:MAG: hypothetical protein JSS65_07235 [Armatimonadetes bacterium]|nr:hypothetical protein [Armatimonadota bacterium]